MVCSVSEVLAACAFSTNTSTQQSRSSLFSSSSLPWCEDRKAPQQGQRLLTPQELALAKDQATTSLSGPDSGQVADGGRVTVDGGMAPECPAQRWGPREMGVDQ